jgi:ribosome biogenesis GTPase A
MMIRVLRRAASHHRLVRRSLLPATNSVAGKGILQTSDGPVQRQPMILVFSSSAAGNESDSQRRPQRFDDVGRPIRDGQLHRPTGAKNEPPPYYSPQTVAKRRKDGSLNAGMKEGGGEGAEKRKQFEEEHHLARALTKFNFDATQIRQWKNVIKTKKWDVAPYQLYPQAPYELDALQEIHSRSYSANVLLEIRDVRVPASSHHPSFTRLAKHRLHLICYTHADMIDAATRDRVEAWSNQGWPGSRSIFVDTRENRSDLPYDLLYDSLLKHLEEKGGINAALTVGVSNTGKSSLLMALIRTARARGEVPKKLQIAQTVGKKKPKRKISKSPKQIEIQDRPGKTREITEYVLREKPRAFFLDVPGMTPPPFFFADRPEAWFAFGAANLLPLNKIIENDIQIQLSFCDYVLYAMNRDGSFGYVKKLGLTKPTDDLNEVLQAVKQEDKYANKNDERLAMHRCKTFLKLFNTGNFGSIILDDISKPYKKFVFKDSHFVKKFHQYGSKRDDEQKKQKDVFFDDDFST